MPLRSRGLQMITDALGDMKASRMAADQNQQSTQEKYYAMLLASMPQSQRMATVLGNPNWQQTKSITVPDYQPSDAEVAQGNFDKYIREHTTDPSRPLVIDPVTAAMFNDKLAGAKPFFDAANPRTLYANQSAVAPEVINAQKVQDKLALDANQTREGQQWSDEFNQIKKPESAANIGHVKAMTVEQLAAAGNQRAQAGKNVAETGKIGAETTGIKAQNAMVAGTGGAAATTNPIVQGLVTRTYDPALMRRFKPEEQAALFGAAQAIDPTVNMSDYQVQFGTKKDFNSGKSAQAVRSINQLIGHLKQLNDLKGELNNTNVLPGIVNPIANAVAGQVSPSFQKSAGGYQQTAHAVGNELETMLRGSSQSGQNERKSVMDQLGVNKSPASIDGAISAALNLMASRANELRDQYQKGVGRPADFTMLNPESEKVLRDLGADPSIIATLAGKTTPNPQMPGVAPRTGGAPRRRVFHPETGQFSDQ